MNMLKLWGSNYKLLFLQEVVDFCRKYLIANREAFADKKLDLVINDAK